MFRLSKSLEFDYPLDETGLFNKQFDDAFSVSYQACNCDKTTDDSQAAYSRQEKQYIHYKSKHLRVVLDQRLTENERHHWDISWPWCYLIEVVLENNIQ